MRISTAISAGFAVLPTLTGVSASISPRDDPQTSLTLDPKVIATGFANDGQDVPTAGQVASLTSTNNFINFCLTVPNLSLTNGQQVQAGSCNPAPIGVIPSVDNMPSSKFTVPKNGDTIQADTAFTITMAINNLQTGNFVNAQENYFSAPQQLTNGGLIIGHSHVVVELLQSLTQTTPTNPKQFAFFKGLNAAAANGVLTADVTGGLPAGAYRLCSINSAANHQPAIVPIAQHGSLDDCIYFTASANGAAAPAASSAAAATAAAATSAAATAKGGKGVTTSAAATDAAATAAVTTSATATGRGGKGGKGAAASSAAATSAAVTDVAATSAAATDVAASSAAATSAAATDVAASSVAATSTAATGRGGKGRKGAGAASSAAATAAATTAADTATTAAATGKGAGKGAATSVAAASSAAATTKAAVGGATQAASSAAAATATAATTGGRGSGRFNGRPQGQGQNRARRGRRFSNSN